VTILRPVVARSASRPLGTVGLLALSVGTFTLGVDGFVLAGLLPQVSSSLHVSAGTAGQLTTIFALVYALGSPLIAATAGTWDRRLLLAVGMGVFAADIVLQATGPSFGLVAAGRVVAALGAAAYQATAYSTAGILSDDVHRARSLAVVAGGSSVAIVAGLPFGLLIGQAWGWRAALWVLLALAVLSLLAIRFLEPAYAPRLTLRQRGAVLADRRVLGILAGTVAVLTPGFLVLAAGVPASDLAHQRRMGRARDARVRRWPGHRYGPGSAADHPARCPPDAAVGCARRYRHQRGADRDPHPASGGERDHGRARAGHRAHDRAAAAPVVRQRAGARADRRRPQRLGDLHRQRAGVPRSAASPSPSVATTRRPSPRASSVRSPSASSRSFDRPADRRIRDRRTSRRGAA
jgi:hypothetical protein